MAKAKRCDRCYRYYSHNDTKGRNRLIGFTIAGIRTIDNRNIYDDEFDLCDDCLKDLWVWLGYEEKNDENDPK